MKVEHTDKLSNKCPDCGAIIELECYGRIIDGVGPAPCGKLFQ